MCGTLWVKEKGRQRRSMVLPHSFCKMIRKYLQLPRRKKGPLFLRIIGDRDHWELLESLFGEGPSYPSHKIRLYCCF